MHVFTVDRILSIDQNLTIIISSAIYHYCTESDTLRSGRCEAVLTLSCSITSSRYNLHINYSTLDLDSFIFLYVVLPIKSWAIYINWCMVCWYGNLYNINLIIFFQRRLHCLTHLQTASDRTATMRYLTTLPHLFYSLWILATDQVSSSGSNAFLTTMVPSSLVCETLCKYTTKCVSYTWGVQPRRCHLNSQQPSIRSVFPQIKVNVFSPLDGPTSKETNDNWKVWLIKSLVSA